MARKDEIFKTFLEHPILTEKYNLSDNDLPKSLAEGLQSDVPIVKSIALIVSNLEVANPVNDSSLRNIVTSYLNAAI
jgi:hypothetical protein